MVQDPVDWFIFLPIFFVNMSMTEFFIRKGIISCVDLLLTSEVNRLGGRLFTLGADKDLITVGL